MEKQLEKENSVSYKIGLKFVCLEIATISLKYTDEIFLANYLYHIIYMLYMHF